MSQELLDTRALEIATRAESKIDNHEAICELRYLGINKTMTKIENSIGALFNRFWAAAIAIIGMQSAAIIYIIMGGHV